MCLEAATGKEKWSKDLAKDCEGYVMSSWNWSESVLIDGDTLVCTPGSDTAAMLALDKNDGKERWRTAVKGAGGAGYSSVVIAEVKGVKMYINWLGSGLIGVNAKDGKLLWKSALARNGTANIPTPLVQDDLVFCSTGYDAGSALLRLVLPRTAASRQRRNTSSKPAICRTTTAAWCCWMATSTAGTTTARGTRAASS